MKLTHTIISKDDGRYRSFPDVARAADGTLIVVFRDADKHVADECSLMISRSYDNGASFSEAVLLDAVCGHMPRITTFSDGRLVMIDDGAPPNQEIGRRRYIQTRLFVSEDNGKSFRASVLSPGTLRDIPDCPTFAPDRIMPLSENEWIVMAQVRLGRFEFKHSFANFIYRTEDGGKNWHVEEICACDLSRRLTEPSMFRLSDGRLMGVYRDNFLNNRSAWNIGSADGHDFGELHDAPIFGHRPTAGLLSDGRMLVIYRKVDNPCGTAAWLGTVDEFMNGDKSGEFMIRPAENGIPWCDVGYNGWVEIAPGVVFAVYHHADKSGKSYICGVKIEIGA